MTVPDPDTAGPADTVAGQAPGAPVAAAGTPVLDGGAPGTAGPTEGADPAVADPEPEPDYTVPTGPPDGSPDFRMALVSSVTIDLPNQHPAVCLREMETPRRQLTFPVGLQDGVALSHAMRRIPTPRPLTHELMSGVLQRFDIDLVAVRIVGRVGSVHFAELDLRGTGGRSVHSCRPTDGLILALHQPVQVPILIDARLLQCGDDVPPPGGPA
ncbi:MAG TPA: bifunctional nuclease domain-containing protein [Acidimicrobiales bacterium]